MTAPLYQTKNNALATVRHVFYVGPDSSPTEASLAPLGEQVSLQAEAGIVCTLIAAARHQVDIVIVDQTQPDDASQLLIDALAKAARPPHIIVLARPRDAGRFLQHAGVDQVVTVPLLPRQLRDAVMAPTLATPSARVPDPEAGDLIDPPWLVRQSRAAAEASAASSPSADGNAP